jgi:NAD(P)-dependent dehydrogenase (short-subunit alcohol dehydrogenase family)
MLAHPVGSAFALQGDLTRVAAVVRLFDEAVKRYGRVDIAINTVGQVLKKPFVETTEEEYDRIVIIATLWLRFCLCISRYCLISSRATLVSAAQPDTLHSIAHPQRYRARAEATK